MKTKQMKKKAKKSGLNFIWYIRLKMRAEGNKLWTEAIAESDELRAESNRLKAESDKLWAESDKLWAEAIIEVYGNIKLEWKNYNVEKNDYECHLETGEVFKP